MRVVLNLVAITLALVSFAIPPPYGMMPAGMSLGMSVVLLTLKTGPDNGEL